MTDKTETKAPEKEAAKAPAPAKETAKATSKAKAKEETQRYRVLVSYSDRHTGRLHVEGSVAAVTEARHKELAEKGILADEPLADDEDEEDQGLGEVPAHTQAAEDAKARREKRRGLTGHIAPVTGTSPVDEALVNELEGNGADALTGQALDTSKLPPVVTGGKKPG